MYTCMNGNAEFAGGACRSGHIGTMSQGWKLQEWTMWNHVAGVDFAKVDISTWCGKGGNCGSGHCRSGQIGTTGNLNM